MLLAQTSSAIFAFAFFFIRVIRVIRGSKTILNALHFYSGPILAQKVVDLVRASDSGGRWQMESGMNKANCWSMFTWALLRSTRKNCTSRSWKALS